MARAKNIRSLNQRPGQQIKEQYRGCNRVGWPSHWDVGQPLNHQHEMSNMPAVAQAIFFRRRHQPRRPSLANSRPGGLGQRLRCPKAKSVLTREVKASTLVGSSPMRGHRRRAGDGVAGDVAATQVNLRDMAYSSRSLSGRMSVGVQSDPTELAATQTAAWPWVRAGVASTLNCTPDRR
jgi:hypothetical protein